MTSNSRLVHELVRRLCAELLMFFPQLQVDDEQGPDGEAVDALGGKVSRLPADFAELCAVFHSLLREASRLTRLYVVLDGLELLRDTDRAHSLDWLVRL